MKRIIIMKSFLRINFFLLLTLFAHCSFEIRSEVKIHASQKEVWKTIINMDKYHEWNTQMYYLEGRIAKGEVIKLKLDTKGADPYEFQPIINHWEEEKIFGWIARTGIPYIFDGEHIFELSEENGSTNLINRETYSGILSPIIKQLPMMKEAHSGFEKMNQELKTYVESTKKAKK